MTLLEKYRQELAEAKEKKYVLLREFARPNKEWAEKADYIEFLYTDEAEHLEDIQRLWENRRKRLAK